MGRILFVLFFLTLPMSARAQKKIVVEFSINDLPAYQKLYEDIFKTFNAHSDKYLIQLIAFPVKRAHIVANEGRVDGVAIKAEEASPSIFENLVKISTPLFHANSILVIHSNTPDIVDIRGFDGQKIAIVNGAVHSMNIIPKDSWFFVNSHRSGMMMVTSKRVRGMSTLEMIYFELVKSSPESAESTRLASMRVKVPFYIFVHKRNKNLISHLEELAKKIGESGEGQKIYDQQLEKVREAVKKK